MRAIERALDAEGLFATREDDEETFRISFKSEGDRYFAVAYRNDPQFVMIGSGWALAPDVDILRAVQTANMLNARKKFVKTAIWEDERDALFTVELCYDEGYDLESAFPRLLDALRETTVEFFSALRGDPGSN
jgi:hypothetical protein